MVVERLLPQVDELRVYMNEWASVPAFLDAEGIKITRSQDSYGDIGDLGKIANLPGEGDILLVDDDILYPVDYAETMSKMLIGDDFIGVHGATLKRNYSNYFTDRHVRHFKVGFAKPAFVDVLGTGTVAFESCLQNVFDGLANFAEPNMLDIHLACMAKEYGLYLTSIARKAGWLRSIGKDAKSLWDTRDRSGKVQTDLLKKYHVGEDYA